MTGAILNRQGIQIEVTNLDEGIVQCKEAINYLRRKTGIKFPEALKDWEHNLQELEKIKIKNKQTDDK